MVQNHFNGNMNNQKSVGLSLFLFNDIILFISVFYNQENVYI